MGKKSKAAKRATASRTVSALERAISAHRSALRSRRISERAEKNIEAKLGAMPPLKPNEQTLRRAQVKVYHAWRAETAAFHNFIRNKPAGREITRYAQYVLRAVKGRVGNPLPPVIYQCTLDSMGLTWEQMKEIQQTAYTDFYAAIRALANERRR